MTHELQQAIDAIRECTPANNPWVAEDVSTKSVEPIDGAIATILNAVVAGDLRHGYGALPSQQAQGWQPIETAPRDGSRFIAKMNDHIDGIRVCWFVPDEDYGGEMLMDEWETDPSMTEWLPLPTTAKKGGE